MGGNTINALSQEEIREELVVALGLARCPADQAWAILNGWDSLVAERDRAVAALESVQDVVHRARYGDAA